MSARFAPAPGAFLCALSEVPDGGGREVVFGEGRDAFRVLLLRRGEAVFGYRNSCPHFSLPLNYAAQTFVFDGGSVACAHHGALFRFEDGACLDGPCGNAGLDPFPIRREGEGLHAGGPP